MPIKLKNNAASFLAASVSTTDTALSVTPGGGALFPVLAAGDWFPATIINNIGEVEIVRVIARSGDTFTLLRAQEDTPARAFAAGARIEHRITQQVLEDIISDVKSRIPSAGGTTTGDLTVTRGDQTGCVWLGTGGNRHLLYNGSYYNMPAADLMVNGGKVWTSATLDPSAYLPLSGGTMTGNLNISNTAPTIYLSDTDNVQRALHNNTNNIGFLKSDGNWAAYSANNGDFVATGNVGAYSDQKWKTNIETVGGALAIIGKLRGVRYTDNRDGRLRVGVIAQEVREYLPEVVGEGADGLFVDYGNIVGVLIEAVKELAGEVSLLNRGL